MTDTTDIDILLITHTRADYLERSLPKLLSTLPGHARLWVWQNERHDAVSRVIAEHRDHPRFHHHRVSDTNDGIIGPTRWFWSNSEGGLVGKVDDDCLVPDDWVVTFERAHADAPELGIVACWHFQADDLLADTVARRGVTLPGGHTIVRNCWVGGSGYLMKRECVTPLPADAEQPFTGLCIDIAARGYTIGWYHPLFIQDHMDDPRSPNTKLHTDADLIERMPLSVARMSDVSIAAWQRQLERSAITVQTVSLNPKDHRGWRVRARRLLDRIRSRTRRANRVPGA